MSPAASHPKLALDALAPGQPMILNGNPLSRGRGQSTADTQMRQAVFQAVMGRLETARHVLSGAASYLAEQWAFTSEHAPGQMRQIQGIAEGYGIEASDLFAYLHLGIIEDAKGLPLTEEDGCSVVACQLEDAGPMLAKNRDYRGEHRALQRVFLEADPAWGKRRIMAVGSLGSPGAFSSGMNYDGLALADTRIAWQQPGVGWLRYLLMNEILIRAGTVAEALAFIESLPHAGGGSLVLMDAKGDAASVELGSGKVVHVTRADSTGIGHTNHFLAPNLRAGQTQPNGQDNSGIANSRCRQARIEHWLANTTEDRNLTHVADLMTAHQANGAPALCRHGGADYSETISTALFACASRKLYFCPGNPCKDSWRVYSF